MSNRSHLAYKRNRGRNLVLFITTLIAVDLHLDKVIKQIDRISYIFCSPFAFFEQNFRSQLQED